MRLTEEQIRFIKSKGLRNGYDNPSVSAVAFNLCDTIEAIQQEIEQLQTQAVKMLDAFRQVQHDIDGAECRDDLDGIKGYVDETLAAIERIGGKEE